MTVGVAAGVAEPARASGGAPPGRAEPAIRVEGLAKRYGDRHVLEDVSFDVDAGTIVALLGPNGAGKTTTVEILEGYRRADAGRASLLGFDPVAEGASLRPRVGVMLQAGGLYALATPREVLRLFASYFAEPINPEDLLGTLGLDAVANARIRTLSGGERQRLGLALALVGRPEVLLLDEPTAGMDPEGRQRTRALLEEWRANGVAILLTTHDLTDVERLADRVVVIAGGRIVADAAPDDLARGERVLRFRLDRSLDVDDRTDLGRELRGGVERGTDGWLRLVDADADPARVATLAAWCAARSITIVELRIGSGSLEDRYLELVGPEATP